MNSLCGLICSNSLGILLVKLLQLRCIVFISTNTQRLTLYKASKSVDTLESKLAQISRHHQGGIAIVLLYPHLVLGLVKYF